MKRGHFTSGSTNESEALKCPGEIYTKTDTVRDGKLRPISMEKKLP